MAMWLEDDLMATTQDWIIAYWHHPPYSRGSHDSDVEGQLIDMRANLLPILEAGGVDLVLSGHSRSYERSVLLDGHYGFSSTLDPDTMVLDHGDGDPAGDGPYTKLAVGPASHLGAVYAVAGSSGQLNSVVQHPVMVTWLEELGSLVLEVNGPQFEARFLDSTGAVLDHFAIHKPVPGAPACSDGVDNDGDGKIDFDLATFASPGDENTPPAGVGDPVCLSPSFARENSQCQDGIHNDGDGKMDYDAGLSVWGVADPAGPDPQCVNKPWRNQEGSSSSTGWKCGLGYELVFLLPLLLWLQGRRGRRRA